MAIGSTADARVIVGPPDALGVRISLSPRVLAHAVAAAGGELPLGFGGQPFAGPLAVRVGIVPVEADCR